MFYRGSCYHLSDSYFVGAEIGYLQIPTEPQSTDRYYKMHHEILFLEVVSCHIALDTKINQNDASVYSLKRSPKKKHLDLTISDKDEQTHERNKEYLEPSSLCFPGIQRYLQTLKASNSAIDNPRTLHFAHCKRDTLDAKAHRVRHVAGSLLTQPLHSGLDLCTNVSHLRGTSPCLWLQSQDVPSLLRVTTAFHDSVSEYHHLRKPKMAISCFKRFQAQLWGLAGDRQNYQKSNHCVAAFFADSEQGIVRPSVRETSQPDWQNVTMTVQSLTISSWGCHLSASLPNPPKLVVLGVTKPYKCFPHRPSRH